MANRSVGRDWFWNCKQCGSWWNSASPTIIEAEPVDKTIIINRFIVSDSELENMDINDPAYFEKMGARLTMSRSNEDVEIL